MESLTSFVPTTLQNKRDDDTDTAMPSVTTTTSDSDYTTPAVSVPPNSNNPYILRQDDPNGTVFIAVGAIVGAILIGFVLYHLFKSLKASSTAKKTLPTDGGMYEKYNTYGLTPSSTNTIHMNMNTEYQLSVAKLPLLSHNPSKSLVGTNVDSNLTLNGSEAGDTSFYNAGNGQATSKHDLTKMFISPTAEAMNQKRNRSSHYIAGNGSVSNISLMGGSTPNLGSPLPASNRHSQLVPSLYVNNDINNSDYSLVAAISGANPVASPGDSAKASPAQKPRSNRKTIPSMYLDDLIDK